MVLRSKRVYVTNGIESLYVDTLISVPAFEPLTEEPASSSPGPGTLITHESPTGLPSTVPRNSPKEKEAGDTRSEASLLLDDGIKIVHS